MRYALFFTLIVAAGAAQAEDDRWHFITDETLASLYPCTHSFSGTPDEFRDSIGFDGEIKTLHERDGYTIKALEAGGKTGTILFASSYAGCKAMVAEIRGG